MRIFNGMQAQVTILLHKTMFCTSTESWFNTLSSGNRWLAKVVLVCKCANVKMCNAEVMTRCQGERRGSSSVVTVVGVYICSWSWSWCCIWNWSWSWSWCWNWGCGGALAPALPRATQVRRKTQIKWSSVGKSCQII